MFPGKKRLVWLTLGLFLCCLSASAKADLVAYWSFDDPVGSTVASALSGPGFEAGYFDAALSSRWNVGHDGMRFGEAGVFGGTSLYFPGTDWNNLAFNKIDAMYNGSFTYSTWVKLERNDTDMQFFGDWYEPWAFRFFYQPTGAFVSNIRRPNPPGGDVASHGTSVPGQPGAWDTGEWYHLAVVFDDAKGSCTNYINGVPAGTHYFAPEPRMDNSGEIGRQQHFGWKQDDGNPATAFQGWMDETYVFNNPLTRFQVRCLYDFNSTELPASQRYVGSSIPLGDLFNSNKSMTLNEAIGSGVFNTQASTNNVGVASLNFAGDFTAIKDSGGVFDLTGAGSKFNLENLGINAGGYSSAIRNGCIANGDGRFSINGVDWGLGMHANCYVTFDLAELRLTGGLADDTAFQFMATAGCNSTSGSVNLAVIVWDGNNTPIGGYINGTQSRDFSFDAGTQTWKFDAHGQTNDGGQERVIADGQWISSPALGGDPWNAQPLNIAVPGNARYITLVSANANGDMNSDHGAFAGAKLSIVADGIWLNQLFGTSSSEYANDPWGLDYTHMRNWGQAANTADIGVFRIAQGELAADFALNNSTTFNVLGLSAIGQGHGVIFSNRCGANEDPQSEMVIVTERFREAAIGVHANGMVTFDLNELRELRGWDDGSLNFSATFASAHPGGDRAVTGLILVSNDTDGILQAFYQGNNDIMSDLYWNGSAWAFLNPANILSQYGDRTDYQGVDFDFQLDDRAQYLSLFVLDGGYGINSSHGAYFNPWLSYTPNAGDDDNAVPEPTTWAMLILGILGLGYYRKQGFFTTR